MRHAGAYYPGMSFMSIFRLPQEVPPPLPDTVPLLFTTLRASDKDALVVWAHGAVATTLLYAGPAQGLARMFPLSHNKMTRGHAGTSHGVWLFATVSDQAMQRGQMRVLRLLGLSSEEGPGVAKALDAAFAEAPNFSS